MFIFKQKAEVSRHIEKLVVKGNSIGFVPTMGALHNGHLSLLKQCKLQCDIVVCSIFVNPTQFNDPTDFEKYPITIEDDIYKLEQTGCDILFLPAAMEIYPEGWQNQAFEHYDLGFLETVFEGEFRPGHFQGVCQVVYRLLKIVQPHFLFLGQKDFQQCMVINRLLQIMHSKTKLVICNTLRENDGLAMSSRNVRLQAEERTLATGIYKTLTYIKENLQSGDLTELIDKARAMLLEYQLKPDYLQIARSADLMPLDQWDGHTDIVALVAAFMGKVRLIDNMILHPNFAAHEN